jgi:hypothetical protein
MKSTRRTSILMSVKLLVNLSLSTGSADQAGKLRRAIAWHPSPKLEISESKILDRESLGLEGWSGSLKLAFSVFCCVGQLTGKMVNLGKRMRRLKPV